MSGSSRSASARAIRCASRPACRSMAMTSTRPPRRSRPTSPLRSPSAAARGRLPRRRARSCASSPTGRARKRVGLPLDGRAPARDGAEIMDTAGRRIGGVTSRRLRRHARRADRHGLCRRGLRRRPAPRLPSTCAARRCRRRVAALPFVPHRYYRKPRSIVMTTRYTRTMNGSASRATSPSSASREYAQEQLGDIVYRRAARGRQEARPRAPRRPWSNRSRRRARSTRRWPARWLRSIRRSPTSRPQVNESPEGAGWFVKLKLGRSRRARRASWTRPPTSAFLETI